MDTQTYTGSCHCGRIRFEVTTNLSRASECNCSICRKRATCITWSHPSGFVYSPEQRIWRRISSARLQRGICFAGIAVWLHSIDREPTRQNTRSTCAAWRMWISLHCGSKSSTAEAGSSGPMRRTLEYGKIGHEVNGRNTADNGDLKAVRLHAPSA